MFDEIDRNLRNRILAVICILLFVLLAGLLRWSNKRDAEVMQKIQEESESDKAVSADKESKEPKEKDTLAAEAKQENEAQTEKAKGLVCWGDELVPGEDAGTYSYKVHLQKFLDENGYALPVLDKTLQGAGTLSMMTMAGVPEETVQGYITAHQEAAGGSELPVTETGIRDLTPDQTERNDLEYSPIIFMGYYGGWNHDPAELAGQQENILHTFPRQERFLIVGTRPLDGSVDSASLDAVMSEKWGEHYISLAALTTQPAENYDTQEVMAQGIIRKLEELGYISK